MKLTLIRISEMVAESGNALTTPPVGVAYLAGYLRRAGHEVCIIDGVGEAIERYEPIFSRSLGFFLHGLTLEEIVGRIEPSHSELIGVSCMFSQDWPVAKRLLAMIRRRFPRSRIVCGGEHVSAMMTFTLEECPAVDFCVSREGEATLLELVTRLQHGHHAADNWSDLAGIAYRDGRGRIVVNPHRPRIADLDDIPYPAWDLVPIEKYLASGSGFGVNKGRNMPIVASRGCPYACTFCSNVNMWTRQWDARDPIKVVDEMEHDVQTYGATNFDFYDLTAIVRKDWIMAFCAELDRRRLGISYQLPSGTRSEAIDEEVAASLKRTGCCHIVYAPESGSQRTLRRIKKQIKLSRLFDSMRAAVRAGTFVKANIVLGFPGDTHVDIWRTLAFLARLARIGVHDVFIYTFSPYPGSPLFEELRASGRIRSLDEKYFFDLTAYIKLTQAISYTDHVSSPALAGYRFFGLLLFYGLSFALRPGRLLRILKNLACPQSDTRIEQFIKSILRPSASSGRGLVKARKHGAIPVQALGGAA